MFALQEINQMEQEMCSYLEWQLNVEPSKLKEFELMVCKVFKGQVPLWTHFTFPTPFPGPFTHPRPSTSNIPTTIPSFGSRALQSTPQLPPQSCWRGPYNGHQLNHIPHPQMVHKYPFPHVLFKYSLPCQLDVPLDSPKLQGSFSPEQISSKHGEWEIDSRHYPSSEKSAPYFHLFLIVYCG